jgi:two-component system response regulator DevR
MSQGQSEPPRATGTISVVLVEDHAMLAELLTILLTDAGIRVLASVGTRRSGHEAVALHRPHLAIIDNELPDGSGIDLCRSLTAEVPEVALLLHTGYTSTQETQAAMDAGAAAVVLKSPRGDGLLRAIQMHAPGLR